ncbi:membrane associated rhomboid family serine protease [Bradyrhizobium sp. USDA 377]
MRTLLIILGIWLLINVLFVVVMIPPRKPRTANVAGRSGDATAIAAGMNSGTTETADDRVLLRHVVIAVALGAFFSLTPPLLEAYDAIKRLVSKRVYKSKENPDGPNGDAQADEG